MSNIDYDMLSAFARGDRAFSHPAQGFDDDENYTDYGILLDSVTIGNESMSGKTVATGDPNSWHFNIAFEFVVHGVLLCVVGLLGLLGNCISIIILSRPQMKSSINTILIGLVSCDSLLIVTSIFLFSFTVFRHTGNEFFWAYYWNVYPYILPIVYPIGLMAQTGSAYMTLGVTIERYLVVCWPLEARSFCTNGRAKMVVLTFAIIAILYNIPRFFEVTWKTKYNEAQGVNRTVFEATELRKNPRYISIYVTWLYLVFMYIVPFVSLAGFNLRIFLEIRKANATRAILSNQEKKEHNLAVMLLVVVLIFFICNMLPLIANILELFQINQQQLIQVSNLLVTINSSVNILIYCIFGNKFKTVFLQIFCGRKPRIQTVRTGLEFRRSLQQQQNANSTVLAETMSCRSMVTEHSGGSGGHQRNNISNALDVELVDLRDACCRTNQQKRLGGVIGVGGKDKLGNGGAGSANNGNGLRVNSLRVGI